MESSESGLGRTCKCYPNLSNAIKKFDTNFPILPFCRPASNVMCIISTTADINLLAESKISSNLLQVVPLVTVPGETQKHGLHLP